MSSSSTCNGSRGGGDKEGLLAREGRRGWKGARASTHTLTTKGGPLCETHGKALGVDAVLEDALDDAATVRVLGEVAALALEGVHDELDVRVHAAFRHDLDALLHHMVAVLVRNALHHAAPELAHDGHQQRQVHGLERFLHHSAAVHVVAQLEHMAFHCLQQRHLAARANAHERKQRVEREERVGRRGEAGG